MAAQTREPLLHAFPIEDLRPTQITVGMREVEVKRKNWRDRQHEKFENFLAAHMAPTILGPNEKRFLIDHHHLALALSLEKVDSIFVSTVADLSHVDPDIFWNVMEFRGWTHPFDAKGRRRAYDDIPKGVSDLKDDPYRSLAGELRDKGGFAKDATPFSEFIWADFFRGRIEPKTLAKDFSAALEKAYALAKSEDANYLPGWCAERHPKSAKKLAKAGRH